MRRSHTGLAVVALLMVVVTAGGGCSGGEDGTSPGAERGGMVLIGDLNVTSPGELSWEAVDAAHDYTVVARGGDDVESWTGSTTHVDLAEEAEAVAPPPANEDAVTPGALVQGATYRWFVTAYDADGTVLGSSDLASFRCAGTCAAVE